MEFYARDEAGDIKNILHYPLKLNQKQTISKIIQIKYYKRNHFTKFHHPKYFTEYNIKTTKNGDTKVVMK
jgi:hypothetical protein